VLLITNYIPFPREGFERVVGRFILFPWYPVRRGANLF